MEHNAEDQFMGGVNRFLKSAWGRGRSLRDLPLGYSGRVHFLPQAGREKLEGQRVEEGELQDDITQELERWTYHTTIPQDTPPCQNSQQGMGKVVMG